MRTVSDIFENALKEGRTYLLEPEAKTVCSIYGIPVTHFKVAKTAEEAIEAAEEIGYPVVLKVISPQIIHKSDVGGVAINLDSPTRVREAYVQIIENVKKHEPAAKVLGVLVEEMAPSPSVEVIVGANLDPQFGPMIMFGLGGIFVEVFKDVTFRNAPITEADAREMLTEIKGYKLLMGYRGRPPADTEAIINILLNTSRLVTEHEEIKELDLNPIFVYRKGAKTVDARILLKL
ncbi:MAG TPA: acetyl-CoA synthetase [Candidatus Bathyarchaeota archaeon]|nr:acetyl-CoA synthetase [Candidatus Bathyarchaeota archaeon]HEX68990.1 acetyl-CoA synthetase [Candidatus Bathyarchaeota archaeon]